MNKPDGESSPSLLVNAEHQEASEWQVGHYGGSFKVLTPGMRPAGGSLGVNEVRLPPGQVSCPFHYHLREDEVFYIISGRGLLRFGDSVHELRPGDTVSCPAGLKKAHQLACPKDASEDLIYLAIGHRDPHEVCIYPDSGKIMVRSQQTVGRLSGTEYMDGEPDAPPIFDQPAQAPGQPLGQ